MSEEGWETSSGRVDEFDAKVLGSRFGFIPEYNNGDTLMLLLDVKSDDLDVGFDGDGTDTLSFACGADWDMADSKGTAAKHPGDKPDKLKRFNNASGVGILIESAKQVPELVKVLQERGDAREAKVWDGLTLSFRNKTFTRKINGEDVTYSRWEVWGLVGVNGAGSAEASVASAATSTAAASSDGEFLTGKVKVQLKKLASEHEDQNAFIEAALVSMPEVAEAGALQDWMLADGSREIAAAF